MEPPTRDLSSSIFKQQKKGAFFFFFWVTIGEGKQYIVPKGEEMGVLRKPLV